MEHEKCKCCSNIKPTTKVNVKVKPQKPAAVMVKKAAVKPQKPTKATKSSKIPMTGKAITLTLGEVAENHRGNQQIGVKSKKGFSKEHLREFKRQFDDAGFTTEIVDLIEYLPEEYHEMKGLTEKGKQREDTGFVLIVRNGIKFSGVDPDALFQEQIALEYDKKAKMYGKVCNKKARHNLCFDHKAQSAVYEEGKGTIYPYSAVPLLGKLRSVFSNMVETEGYPELKVESNLYYDVTKCGIGYHGDTERSLVIGARLGETIPLTYRWHLGKPALCDPIPVTLNHGDIYFMSEKATGNDWKKSSHVTLRHAAGCSSFTQLAE